MLAATCDESESCKLVARRPGWLLRLLRFDRTLPRPHGTLYWPIDLIGVSADIKLPFRRFNHAKIPIAHDAVTGRLGVLDKSMPAPQIRAVSPRKIVAATPKPSENDPNLYEFARDQIIRRYRPTEIRNLEVEGRDHVHLPYHTVVAGDTVYLVDRFAAGVDYADRYPHAHTVDGAPINRLPHENRNAAHGN